MAIDRTAYNALVDDSGTGTDGSVWDKAAIKTVLLDPIDAAIAGSTGTPGGATTQVQFNDAGVFAGDAGLLYDKTTDRLTTGLVTLSGGQIVFPSTPNLSSNTNTLDDYREGTWTGVIGGSGGTSGQTYLTRYGRYVKVGRHVSAWAFLPLSNKGTITGNVQIQGLPFPLSADVYAPVMIEWQNLAVAKIRVSGLLSIGTQVIDVFGIAAANISSMSGGLNLVTADISNATAFFVWATYDTTA